MAAQIIACCRDHRSGDCRKIFYRKKIGVIGSSWGLYFSGGQHLRGTNYITFLENSIYYLSMGRMKKLKISAISILEECGDLTAGVSQAYFAYSRGGGPIYGKHTYVILECSLFSLAILRC